jgi:hypothetical protein
MSSSEQHPRRAGIERRASPTTIWNSLSGSGRRTGARRDGERGGNHFVDRFPAPLLALIVALLVLSIVDAVITLELIDSGCDEINPLMAYLLERGPFAFLVGKFLLTAAGLPLLVVFKNFSLFGSRLRVGHLIPVLVGLYFVLLAYQVVLLRSRV